jgi:uncharacterized protein (DUF1810 family)
MPGSPDDFVRFVLAQAHIYDDVLAELRTGRKRSHWMWFIFPQIQGLGSSEVSRRFAIASAADAREYLEHPILGPRLRECAALVLAIDGRSATEIFGRPDDLKLRSCATLFARVSPPGSVFHRLLDRFFAGKPDEATLRQIG